MKNVGIICGGYSSEYAISVLSATTIQSHLPSGYVGFLVYLTKEGWHVEIDGERLTVDPVSFSFEQKGKVVKLDVAIVYVHGDPGENGKVQALLEMNDIPYVNSGPLASQLSFDKWYCNQFLKGFGYAVADSVYLTDAQQEVSAEDLVKELGLPMFIKPCDSGSSFGIAKANTDSEVLPAIKNAFAEGRTVVIERFLDGTEVTCGVFRSERGVEALPLTEIVSENDFFDYEAKYEGLSQEIVPARISEEQTLKVQEISREIYQLLQLRSIARIDFMLVNDVPHIIEVNTTPGFSPESIVPKMIAAEGLSITEFWEKILAAELT